jgi:hypothetical protein
MLTTLILAEATVPAVTVPELAYRDHLTTITLHFSFRAARPQAAVMTTINP